MPVLSGLYAPDLVEYTARLGEESVTICFDRSKMNIRREVEVQKAAASGDIEKIVAEIVRMFVRWDVVDDAGQPVPMTADLLFDLPSKTVENLLEGMQEASTPTSEEGNASSATSSTQDTLSMPPPASLLNGPQPSPSPQPSESLSTR